ncbi:MAG: hypothetical protein H6612_05660 [Ignavibacteriales bacterium]|nr:hypothetical protein [Ignavibacteriales bacterium]
MTLGNSKIFNAGHFEEGVFLYSGGFVLSGYSNGELWANGVCFSLSELRIIPGKINSDPNDL